MNKYTTFRIAILAYFFLMSVMFLEFLALYSGTLFQGIIDNPALNLAKGTSLFIAYLFTGLSFLKKTSMLNIPMAAIALVVAGIYSMAYSEDLFWGHAFRELIDNHRGLFGWSTIFLSTLLAGAVALFRKDGERGLVVRAIVLPPLLCLIALPFFNDMPLFSFANFGVSTYLFTFMFCALNVFLVPMLYTLVFSKMPRNSLVMASSITGGTFSYMIGKLGALGYVRDTQSIADEHKVFVLVILIAMVLYVLTILRLFKSSRAREA